MTISTTLRKAGPFEGNGLATAFPFNFKVFTPSDLRVTYTSPGGLESVLTLGSDYTVDIDPQQEQTPGGRVVMATAPSSGELITISSALAYTQPLKITNQGGFYPAVLNNALDRLTIFVQQLDEQVARTVKVNISSSTSSDELIAELRQLAVLAAASAAQAELAKNAFKLQYLGALSIPPTTRYDGTTLQAGDYYFNLTTLKPHTYSGSNWVETIPDSYDTLMNAVAGLKAELDKKVGKVNGFEAVGSFAILKVTAGLSGDYLGGTATAPGSVLARTSFDPSGALNVGGEIVGVGTWQNMGPRIQKLGFGFFQRVA